MADNPQSIKQSYPLPAYNYRVHIDHDGDLQTIGFSEVSGLEIAAEPVVYTHGMSFLLGRTITPGMARPVRITLKKGIIKQTSRALIDWVNDTYRGLHLTVSQRTVIIELCDEAAQPLVRWTARNALPVRLEGPQLDAYSNEAAIDLFELIADQLLVAYDL